MDATKEKKLAERFEIKGFPTLKWFVNGQQHEYTGERTKEAIIRWIMKRTGPPSPFVTCEKLDAMFE